MVFISSLVLASSIALSSMTPGAQAAAIPLPLQDRSQRPMMRDVSRNMKREPAPGLKVSPLYDVNHSQHWNYHHGYVNKDGHGHGPPHKRSSEYEYDPDLVDLEVDLVKRSKAKYHQSKPASGHKHTKQVEKDGHLIEVTVGKRHWFEHEHGHEHVHEHFHGHKRSLEDRHEHDHEHIHVHEHDHGYYDRHGHWHWDKRSVSEGEVELETRDPHHHHRHPEHHHHMERSETDHKRDQRKKGKSHGKVKGKGKKAHEFGVKKESAKGAKKGGAKGKHGSGHKEEKRDGTLPDGVLPASGTPGFVEVASHFFNSTLSRSIAGLVYSANPDTAPNATAFVLGTSNTQSTQFYLTPVLGAVAQSAGYQVVNVRVPILNSQLLSTTDFCASFDLAPPSPLSLLPCGILTGFSQNFAFNSTTSELRPLYSAIPAPMALVDTSNGPVTASSANKLSDTPTPLPNSAQSISLFFVPASTFYKAPVPVQALFDDGVADQDTPSSDDASENTFGAPVVGAEQGDNSNSTLSSAPTATSSDPAGSSSVSAFFEPTASSSLLPEQTPASSSDSSDFLAPTPTPAPSLLDTETDTSLPIVTDTATLSTQDPTSNTNFFTDSAAATPTPTPAPTMRRIRRW
ncbi:hypothetical protein T439DRAFT_349915 [Meredithblackwellia eburnea MCA 4105]